ncbi:hypothetical protein I553_5168 [Mycobacterium xenopi 4042]|uniref:Uncharacterized protein n=1 Tax=Mycobacterium xenopi 4042 TaxID=1299334 RepID=X7ZVX4_MYCXE|nr:hypothetical protein I553_5168 [Mycobacterium xenopi 4042]
MGDHPRADLYEIGDVVMESAMRTTDKLAEFDALISSPQPACSATHSGHRPALVNDPEPWPTPIKELSHGERVFIKGICTGLWWSRSQRCRGDEQIPDCSQLI